MNLKQIAAQRAMRAVQSGMVLGLGTGSTATYAIQMIGERLRNGTLRDVMGVATSAMSENLSREVGIPLTNLRQHPVLDLAIDGADEVDPQLQLIKGRGGAHLREKIVARAARYLIIIVDDSKLVQVLGTKCPVPVEVIPFGLGSYEATLRSLGCEPVLRVQADQPFVTDEGNYILDCHFPGLQDPQGMERELNNIPGIVENGIFINLAAQVLVASETGVQELHRK